MECVHRDISLLGESFPLWLVLTCLLFFWVECVQNRVSVLAGGYEMREMGEGLWGAEVEKGGCVIEVFHVEWMGSWS